MIFNKIASICQKNNLIPERRNTIIIGLSGGPDSVFLLHFLHFYAQQKSLTLIAAHLDHEWRTNSAQDVAFCRAIAAQLHIPFVTKKASELSFNQKYNGSKEELGRNMRRFFLQSIKQETHADYIALAHHTDDQQETFFIRLMRGASLTGLCGMKMCDGIYIRPLLHIFKQEILDYLHNNNIAYLSDPTNQQQDFLRNRIRQIALPALRTCDNRFDHTFAQTLEQLQQTEQFLQKLVQQTFIDIATRQPDDSWHINSNLFQQLDPFLQQRIIVHWLVQEKVPFKPSTGLINEIMRFLQNSQASDHQLHESWHIKRDKNTIKILF